VKEEVMAKKEKTLKAFVSKIEFPKLRKQRALLRALMQANENDRQRHELAGLVNLLDDLCDESATVLTEKRVFGDGKNDNCLAGIRCPKCGHEGSFGIAAQTTFTVTDDGTDDHADVEWDSLSWVTCDECGEEGEMWEFQA
jgi:hypothetical protein